MDQAAAARHCSVPGVSSIVVVLAGHPGPRHRSTCELDLFIARPSCINRPRWKSCEDKRCGIAIKGPTAEFVSAAT